MTAARPGGPEGRATTGAAVPAGGGRVRRVAVVWCADWPLVAVGIEAAVPGAVLEKHGSSEKVAACTAAARAAGVRRGQRRRDAQRLCPELVVVERDLDAEGRAFEGVAAAVAELTPRVEVVRPGVCAIPARGAARFHGGEEALRITVQDAVVEAGHDCGVGIADGLFTAELAARNGGGGLIVPEGGSVAFLDGFPLGVLAGAVPGWDVLAEVLVRLGVRTLGELARLPAGDVAGRFGAAGTLAHRLAGGVEPRDVAPHAGLPDLTVVRPFDPPAARSDEVVFAAKALADRLHAGLAAEGLACVRLGVEVEFADGGVSERLWRHEGLLSAQAVAERVRWQLSGWRPADADAVWGGVSALLLVPDQVVTDTGVQRALWGRDGTGARGELPERVARAADRVQAMLGHGALTRPHLTGGRGPGERVLRVPVGDLPLETRPEGPWPGALPTPAPSVVLPEAKPVELRDAEGALVRVTARCVPSAPPALLVMPDGARHRVVSWTGPWPAHERWWDPNASRRLVRLQVLTPRAAHLLTLEHSTWTLEATYD
ncbi:DNA polymerase Y family protein [Actinocorallia sp. API 0066]|uniref:DNA polymerase Y family protein n=1 Tax=Actinocorallia sp. API 0066 TaxID=2896846 RepID=UPI001E53D002|nr:DNA polymerase Y family protein [Actinocorallia sp. API 0066]MCD0451912.1 DNA polymerase Y family protein [Actinocorallia sp. API 0066]